MKIAIFSDSHDNLPHLEKAITLAQQAGLKKGFHLGDFCSPFSVKMLAESGISWQCVWGNNDGDKISCLRMGGPTVDFVEGDYRDITLDGQRIFLTHYPQTARTAALSGLYTACFFGHNHQYSQEILNETLLANPGEILGHRFGQPSFGVYETDNNTVKRILI